MDYIANDGSVHSSKSAAEKHNAEGDPQSEMLGMFAPIVGPLILFVLTIFFLKAVFYFCGMYIKTLFVTFVVFNIAGFIINRITAEFPLKRFLPRIIFLAGIAVSIFTSINYYKTVYENPIFSADYVQALPDGSEPVVYKGRNGKGKELARLKAGEKIRVNGVTRDRLEYNIVTPDGKKGFVTVKAFPEDALPKNNGSNIVEVFKTYYSKDGLYTDQYKSVDRDAKNILERADKEYFVKTDKGRYSERLTGRAQRAARAVNIKTTPAWFYKKGNIAKEYIPKKEIDIVLKNIVYLDDCTIIMIELSNTFDRFTDNEGAFLEALLPLGFGYGYRENKDRVEYAESLVLRDLNVPDSEPVALMNGIRYTYNKDGDVNNNIYGIALIFPPFSSRNFSLTHSVPLNIKRPNPIKRFFNSPIAFFQWLSKEGSDKIFLYSAYLTQWDFPEVRVR